MKILVLLILSRIFYSKQTHETRILFLNHSILLTQMKLKHTTLYIYIYSINPIIIFLVYMQKKVCTMGQLQKTIFLSFSFSFYLKDSFCFFSLLNLSTKVKNSFQPTHIIYRETLVSSTAFLYDIEHHKDKQQHNEVI